MVATLPFRSWVIKPVLYQGKFPHVYQGREAKLQLSLIIMSVPPIWVFHTK